MASVNGNMRAVRTRAGAHGEVKIHEEKLLGSPAGLWTSRSRVSGLKRYAFHRRNAP
jgi:hypothetical protein